MYLGCRLAVFTTASSSLPQFQLEHTKNATRPYRLFDSLSPLLLSSSPHGAPVIAAVPLDIIDWPCNGYAELFLFRPQGRVQIENGALSIAVLNLSDSGMYQCVAENKHGIIYSSAQLMVLGKIASLLLLLSCLSVCAFDHLLR